jgi:hypothetical protein
MPRYVIKTIEHDGAAGPTAFDGIADNEKAAKERMAREHGFRDYATLNDSCGFSGSNDRIVITQEPEPVVIRARGYDFVIKEPGKPLERLTMWDDDEECLEASTQHFSAHLNEHVMDLLAKAYDAGRAAGERRGRYAAKAEIRQALEIS